MVLIMAGICHPYSKNFLLHIRFHNIDASVGNNFVKELLLWLIVWLNILLYNCRLRYTLSYIGWYMSFTFKDFRILMHQYSEIFECE